LSRSRLHNHVVLSFPSLPFKKKKNLVDSNSVIVDSFSR
jgi:hypothetical protein